MGVLDVGGESPTNEGTIKLIIGPMFASKTTELLDLVRRAAFAGQPAVIIKHSGDCRYERGATVVTHANAQQGSTSGSEVAAPIRIVTTDTLSNVDVSEFVVGVDEGQFYPDLVECCERWAVEGRRVIVAALDGDFARRPFGEVCRLVPLCEFVEKRRGVCMVCRGRESAFSQRIGHSTALVEIGAQESYRTVCRKCHAAGSPP